MKCRHCEAQLDQSLIDLGSAPPSNAYLTKEDLNRAEKWFPLKVLICDECWLVQTADFAKAHELFDENYAYFSGFSQSWLAHSELYVKEMISYLELDINSLVIEVAANDGYLLQFFQAQNIPCLGIEPTNSTANAARKKGITIIEEFFGVNLANQLISTHNSADLLVANNVLAHVPNINDFIKGFSLLLKPHGVATFEFPHLYKLLQDTQFDTIYHEHFSYLSLSAVQKIFKENGLNIFKVDELSTHGGSIRVFAQRSDTGIKSIEDSVRNLLEIEKSAQLLSINGYKNFQKNAIKIKNDLLDFLITAQKNGKKVVAYGAAAKGNTLLNYAGVRPDLVSYVVDLNPAKQNKFMPGNRIPIVSDDKLRETKPDYILILPWNLKTEITEQLLYVREWNAKFVIAIPNLIIL